MRDSDYPPTAGRLFDAMWDHRLALFDDGELAVITAALPDGALLTEFALEVGRRQEALRADG